MKSGLNIKRRRSHQCLFFLREFNVFKRWRHFLLCFVLSCTSHSDNDEELVGGVLANATTFHFIFFFFEQMKLPGFHSFYCASKLCKTISIKLRNLSEHSMNSFIFINNFLIFIFFFV